MSAVVTHDRGCWCCRKRGEGEGCCSSFLRCVVLRKTGGCLWRHIKCISSSGTELAAGAGWFGQLTLCNHCRWAGRRGGEQAGGHRGGASDGRHGTRAAARPHEVAFYTFALGIGIDRCGAG